MADAADTGAGVGTESAGFDPNTETMPGAHAFLVFLTLLNVMNFVDRQLLSSFSAFIVPELGLTDGQYGLLAGLIFIVFYAAMGLFTGALADKVHRPRLVAAGLALWSALTAASGAARGFISLAIPRMFVGVGESVLTPASMSMLADRFPASRLGFAAGFYYLGVPVGTGVSLIVAGNLGPLIGWRNCFYLLGSIGLVLAVVMLFVKETPRRGAVTPKDATGAEKEAIIPLLFGALARYPSLGLTIAGGVALHIVLGAATFDQLWYVNERGFERAWIANTTGWIIFFVGIAGNLFGGLAGDWFQRATGQGRPMFLFWVMLLLLPVGILYRLVSPDSPLFWVGVSVGVFQVCAFYGPTFSTIQELSPAKARATIVAFYILCLNLIGLGVGVTAAGFAIDWMKAAGWEQPYTWTLLTFTVVSGLAIPLFLLAGIYFKRDKAKIAAGG